MRDDAVVGCVQRRIGMDGRLGLMKRMRTWRPEADVTFEAEMLGQCSRF